MKTKQKADKLRPFLWWMLMAGVSLYIQMMGNTTIPVLKNVGIVVAILLAMTFWIDYKDHIF